MQIQGYKMHYWEKPTSLPSVITIFSAPNYCDCYKNKAAIVKIEGDNFSIKNYEEVSHPYHLPGGLNLFQFSMPYIADKVVDMLYNILKQGEDKPLDTGEEVAADLACIITQAEPGSVMRLKISSVGRVRRMYKNLIEN